MMAKCGSGCIKASTKLDVNNMDARKISNNKVLLNGSRAGARWASMTKLDDKALLL